jgi:hypothetical protein
MALKRRSWAISTRIEAKLGSSSTIITTRSPGWIATRSSMKVRRAAAAWVSTSEVPFSWTSGRGFSRTSWTAVSRGRLIGVVWTRGR